MFGVSTERVSTSDEFVVVSTNLARIVERLSLMNTERAEMEEQLKKHCVSLLRKQGFKGSFPDLYREVDGFVSLINFQFFSSGGSFCVNISYADRGRENIYFRKETEPKKLKVSQTRVHARLGSENLVGDKWFSFGKTSYGEFRGNPSHLPKLSMKSTVLF